MWICHSPGGACVASAAALLHDGGRQHRPLQDALYHCVEGGQVRHQVPRGRGRNRAQVNTAGHTWLIPFIDIIIIIIATHHHHHLRRHHNLHHVGHWSLILLAPTISPLTSLSLIVVCISPESR